MNFASPAINTVRDAPNVGRGFVPMYFSSDPQRKTDLVENIVQRILQHGYLWFVNICLCSLSVTQFQFLHFTVFFQILTKTTVL